MCALILLLIQVPLYRNCDWVQRRFSASGKLKERTSRKKKTATKRSKSHSTVKYHSRIVTNS